MNRTEKIQFIKDVKAGIFDSLHKMRKERLVKLYWSSCFHYLCEHPSLYIIDKSTNGHREPFKITSDLLPELTQELEEVEKDGSLSHLSDVSLSAMCEIAETIKILHERNELHILYPYKKDSI